MEILYFEEHHEIDEAEYNEYLYDKLEDEKLLKEISNDNRMDNKQD
jgi:hypothetical protein